MGFTYNLTHLSLKEEEGLKEFEKKVTRVLFTPK
jgi:hypothetical protein